ncbi:MAG: 50S ribosomal protein L28 [bacterium]
MSYKCDVCGKGTTSGNNVSHSNRRTKRTFKPNLRTVHVEKDGVRKTMKVCTRCLRSNKVQKAGKATVATTAV